MDDIVYLNEADILIAEKNGIDRANAYNRTEKLGWGRERAITQPLSSRPSNHPWYIYKQIAAAHGVTRTTFHERIHRENGQAMTHYEAATTPPLTRNEILAKARQARRTAKLDPKLIEKAEKNGITSFSLYSRIHKLGWTEDQASELPKFTNLRTMPPEMKAKYGVVDEPNDKESCS